MEQEDTSIRDKKLDGLFHSIGKSLYGEPPFYIWPAPLSTPAECEFYLADDFLHDFYTDLIELKQKSYSVAKTAKLLKNPSRIAQTLWPFGHVVNVDQRSKTELIELASFIVDLLSSYRKDPFNRNGKNIVWSQSDIDEYLTKHKVIDSNNSQFKTYRNLISRLKGILWLYSELLFFSIHEICKEFHGPYSSEDAMPILIREYYDLRPEFWPFAHRMPYQNLLIFETYKKDTEIEFDFFGRLRVRNLTPEDLASFSLIVDDTPILAYESIQNICNCISQIAIEGAKYAQNLSRQQVMKKFVYSYYYILKPIKNVLGKNWEPPERIFKDIKHERKKHIVNAFYNRFKATSDLPHDKMAEVISKIFDPRQK